MARFPWSKRPLDLDDDDFAEEIRSHLAIAQQEKMADGLGERDARDAARRELGNVTLTTEAARAVWTPRWLFALREIGADIRVGGRTLARHPGFSLAVFAVLTIGIGLNVAVFTMLKSIAFSPLAGVEHGSDLVVVHGETAAGRAVRLSYPEYRALRDQVQSFDGLMGTVLMKANLGRGRGARQIWGELVTDNYFEVLGIRAALGRALTPADERAPGRDPVAVISEGLWRRDFGSDPAIIGRSIEVNNQQLTVVGIAEAGFHGTAVVYDVEVFVPVMMGPALGFTFGSKGPAAGLFEDPSAPIFHPYARLRTDASRDAAAAEVDALWTRFRRERPPADPIERLRVVPFVRAPGGAPSYAMPTLAVLSVMGLLVLTIACANLSGLALVRGISRRGEIALRLSLGASRRRIVRLLVVENLLLAIPGALAGTLLAAWGIPMLIGYAQRLSAPLRIHFNSDIDGLVLAFAVAAAAGSVLIFGFLPALRSARVNLVTVINEDASPRSAPRGRLRSGLVIAQVAVSVTLLVVAGLAARSVAAARSADPGFDSRQATAVSFDLKQNAYDEARGRIFQQHLLSAVRADPSVESAALAVYTPLNMTDTRVDPVSFEAYAARPGEDLAFMWNIVSAEYFRTLRIPVLAGREFESRDDPSAEPVAVVNRTLATRFLGGADNALGKRLRIAGSEWRRVVGVVEDLKYTRVDEPPRPYFYVPLTQAYRSSVTLHTRGQGGIETLVSQARAHVTRIDPDLPILAARSMAESTRGALIFLDLTAMMLFLFGTAGIGLAVIGTYGLVSFSVQQSRHEIGIRMALGATRTAVVRQFVARGLRLGLAGALAGVVCAAAAGRLMDAVLFGISPTDGMSFARALALVLLSITVASLVPAARAARTNPLSVLRHQ